MVEEQPPKRKIAIALNYTLDGPCLPKITASGQGIVAEKILALAFEHGVRVREDADLASLLTAVPLDSEIPPEAILAVAEILSYIYRQNGLKRSD
ncbi:MAG: EscU/YscU/HrcU family type III secretion system export apparatus switch protein [Alphaproteobacteria bacterium]